MMKVGDLRMSEDHSGISIKAEHNGKVIDADIVELSRESLVTLLQEVKRLLEHKN